MREFSKPIVVASRCLGFEVCRYNEEKLENQFIDKLKKHVEFITVCPEVEIGMSIPRDPIRIVLEENEYKLLQPTTGKDFTEDIKTFSINFLKVLTEVDGFILKSRSPSCGIKDTKVFKKIDDDRHIAKGSGLFAAEVLRRFPNIPIEDEGRLTNFRIREHFLTSIFTLARFRKVKKSNSMRELVKFHSDNKLLISSHNKTDLKRLEKIVANRNRKRFTEAIKEYECNLKLALSKNSRTTANVNVLMEAMGYFTKYISHSQKEFILDAIDKYKKGKLPLSALQHLIRSYGIRFNSTYLLEQTFFEPYPEDLMEDLMEITDSGKGKE